MAGSVPTARAPKPRAVAVATVVVPQAQSIAPVAPATRATLFTLGVKLMVMPCATVGKPVEAPPVVAIILKGEAAAIVIFATYLEAFVAAGIALYVVIAAATPGKPSVWKASLTRVLGEVAAITASETFARTV